MHVFLYHTYFGGDDSAAAASGIAIVGTHSHLFQHANTHIAADDALASLAGVVVLFS